MVQDSSPTSSQPQPRSRAATDPEQHRTAIEDPHSFARPEEVSIRHLRLDLDVDFESRRLSGTATLDLDRHSNATEVVLDTWRLDVEEVLDGKGAPARFELGPDEGQFGRPLRITLAPIPHNPNGPGPETDRIVVRYRTSPEATALQWLEPRQTAGGKQPYLFTQSQAILARTWIPLQDTPSVRFTYDAHHPRAAGTARADERRESAAARRRPGIYRFRMPQAIPSYLMALAVGDLEFRELGPRSGVYAEPAMVEGAAWELEPTEDDDRPPPSGCTGRTVGAATTSWCCRRASRSAGWRIRGSPSPRRPSSPATDRWSRWSRTSWRTRGRATW